MGNSFDPDAYLAANSGGFNPDAYLAAHAAPAQETKTISTKFGPIQEPSIPDIFNKAIDYAKKEGAPIAGGIIGGSLGAVGGVPGAIAGAGLGGAAGRAWQRNAEYATGARDPLKDTSLGNAIDIGKSGASQAAAEGGAQAVKAGAEAVAPTVQKTGAALYRMATGTPEKYGEALLKSPPAVVGAPSGEQMSDAYKAFESKTGLKGLAQHEWEAGEPFGAAELEKNVLKTGRAVELGKDVSKQELYTASQSANRLRQMAKFGDPQAAQAAASMNVLRGKKFVENALEEIHPEYADLRTNNFLSNAKEAVSSAWPLNRNMTPDALRGVLAGKAALGAAGAAVGGYEGGSKGAIIGGLAAPLAVSPLAGRLAIQAASKVIPAIGSMANIGGRALAQDIAGSNEPQANEANIPAILRANVLNPDKSGQYAKDVTGLGMPSSMVSRSGKASLSDIARVLHEKGAIKENDEGVALEYLKSLAGKVK